LVKLNLGCRDEIIPILRALQHLYENGPARRELLQLVGKDVNKTSNRKLGRRGLNYWEVTVLAAVRLGCNLDYDKLQDLAENHRTLRQLMGIGDWQDHDVDFDWRRLEDNVTKLRPETLKKISNLVVGVGHHLKPSAIEAVRGDSFVVETNIHYPTDSSLIADGLRKILNLATELAKEHGLSGWRQQQHLLQKIRTLARQIGRLARAKAKRADRLKPGYRELLELAQELLERARQLLRDLAFAVEAVPSATLPKSQEGLLLHYLQLTEKVCDNARRRVLEGETLANEEKVFSLFEPHTELILRGKEPHPIQFGHRVLVVEDAVGFVVEYRVLGKGVLDQEVVVPVMKDLQKRFAGKITSASFDRAFHTPANQKDLAEIVKVACIARKGQEQGRHQQEEGTVAFRKGRKRHSGVESAIGALQAGNGLKRCRDRGEEG
jgi:hypothetical protein